MREDNLENALGLENELGLKNARKSRKWGEREG